MQPCAVHWSDFVIWRSVFFWCALHVVGGLRHVGVIVALSLVQDLCGR